MDLDAVRMYLSLVDVVTDESNSSATGKSNPKFVRRRSP
jgi:hypothetical protein